MFSQAELDRLIDAMRSNGVVALKVESKGEVFSLNLEGAVSSTARLSPEPKTVRKAAKSPSIGRFLPRGADDGLSSLSRSEKVGAGDTLGYITQSHIRAMVIAPADGILTSDVPDEGTVFGHGDVVFNLEVNV